jgi:hypothetical protein
MDSPTAFHGARAIFQIKNKVLAWATDIQIRVMYQNVPVEVLGNPIIQRQVTVGTQVEISCGFVRMIGNTDNDLVAAGQVPAIDDPNGTNLIQWDECRCDIYDTQDTSNPAYSVTGAKPAALSLQMNARSLALHNVSFVGREFHWGSEHA